MSALPPALAARLLARALRSDPAGASILGDLQEDFARIARQRGARAARIWYWREAVLLACARMVRRGGHSDGALREALQDGRYALHVIGRSPAFSFFTAVMIALGVGATTSVFSVMKPLMIAPLPFEDPEALVWIQNRGEPGDNSLSAVTSRTANLKDFRERSRAFDGLTGYNAFFEDQTAYTLTGVGEPERLVGVGVAHDFLDVLGIRPLLGRSFTEEEGRQGGPRAVMLTHGFWVRRFAANPRVLDQTLTLNEHPFRVVGVLPPSFDFSSVFAPGRRVDFLTGFPIAGAEERSAFQGNLLFMIGRLAPGVTHQTAQADLDRVRAALQQENPRRWGLDARLSPLREHVAGPFRPALLLLALASATLLMIVCVNISNLILSRSPSRAREVAVRKAFGARRARLVRQLLLETLGISLLGAVLGSAIAWGATHIVGDAAGVRIPLLADARVEGSVLLFASLVAVLTGLAAGLVPALQVVEGSESSVLRSASRGSSAGPGARRLRGTLVFAEVALACVLLVMGALLVRSFRSALAVDLGFEPRNAIAWQLSPARQFASMVERADFYMALGRRVSEAAGVQTAGLGDGLALGRHRTWAFTVIGGADQDEERRQLFPHVVDPGYLGAMRTRLLAGRNLSSADTDDGPRVVLMNESGARRAFPGVDPLGRRIRIWGPHEWEVVGIVEDVRNVSPEMEAGTQVYFPITQMPDYSDPHLVVRSDLATEEIVRIVSSVLREIEPTIPTGEFWTLESTVSRSLSARRFTLGVLTAFGVAALVLAGLGIYGVLAQSVAERRHEIGIRMALGASASRIVSGLLRQVLFLAGAGVLVGAALSLAGAHLVRSLLFGVSGTDLVSFFGMALVLLAVAVLAAALPAGRAVRTPIMRTLRAE